MKKLLLFLALVLFAEASLAQQVNINTAKSRALSFINSQNSFKKKAKISTTEPTLDLAYTATSEDQQNNLFYIFNQRVSGGFVIVAADESATSILGYSTEGCFDLETAPENFLWWLSQYETQIQAGITQGTAAATSSEGKENIQDLITSKWSQNNPYNLALNSAFQEQTGVEKPGLPVGCVATAIAQVMRYHKYPTNGIGKYTSPIQQVKIDGVNYNFEPKANFGETTYDWSNMIDKYGFTSKQEQKDAVATLMYHLGVATDMSYSQDGSGTQTSNLVLALPKYFGYDKSIVCESRDYFSDQDWEDLVYSELAQGRPMVYAGQTSEVGHAFVCHGYNAEENKFAINWGWGGSYNGYYTLTGSSALRPEGTGTGGGAAGDAYTIYQRVIINIMKDAGGKSKPYIGEISSYANKRRLEVDNSSYKADPCEYDKSGGSKKANLLFSFYNFSPEFEDFSIGVRAYDKTTGITQFFKSTDLEEPIPVNHGYRDYPFDFDLNDFIYNGTYELTPVVRDKSSSNDEDWEPARLCPDSASPIVKVTGATETAISNISADEENSSSIARNILGLKVNTSYKGIVIKNGKKYIQK